MAEKGGKGFTLPKTGKSALKSPAFKGKDDNSAKSKRGRKVQFDSEGSFDTNSTKSNGKADIPSFKGDAGKAGIGEKAGSGGKSQKAPEPLELRVQQGSRDIEKIIDKHHELKSDDRQHDHADVGKSNVSEAFDDHPSLAVELPENTTCLMDCEAADILQEVQERMVVLSADPTLKLPVSFDNRLTYAQRNRLYDNPQAVKEILKPLKQLGVSDAELCMIANFQLESVNEVFALVPSFKNKKNKLRAPLENVLAELAKLRGA